MKKTLLIITALMVVVLSVSSAQTAIAVLDFEGNGVSDAEVSALTDRLRNELTATGEYTVVERDQMEEIIGEQGFQQTGLTSDESIVEVGKLIGVEQMIAGSISKVGDVFSVSARIVNVETGEVLKAVSYDHGGKLSDLLKTGMKDVALELVGQKRVKVPSVAIIPLNNKGEKVDDFYAWGISADLISDVSGAGLIRVASLRQIEELGDIPIEEIARKLFVRYVTTGTLWKIDKVFQLSLELYDTEESKVIWSNRWQESWENLPSIKGKLADNILSALDVSTVQDITKVQTANPDAYEFYLKGEYKYDKRENMEDTEIARGLLKKAIELDDNLIKAKVLLGWTYKVTGDYDKAMEIFTSALKQAEELGDKRGMSANINNIGVIYMNKGDYDKALDYYERSFEISEELGDKRGMSANINNIGSIYENKGDYDKALDYYERSLEISEELGDKDGIGSSLVGIGIVYSNRGDDDKALDYFTRSLEIEEELGDKRGMATSLNNIGIQYREKGDYDKALDYYEKSLEIEEELGDKRGMATSLNNIGSIYRAKGDDEEALDYFTRSLEIEEELGDKRGMASSLNNIGVIYRAKGDDDKTLEYYTRSLEIFEEIGHKRRIGISLMNIGNVYSYKGDYDKALDYYERSLEISEELGDKDGMGVLYWNRSIAKDALGDKSGRLEDTKKAAKLGHRGAQDWLRENGYDW
jgi:tetratricopeptide (TPR) repeat protein